MKGHVLIAEGEEHLRQWLARHLKQLDLSVQAVDSARECLVALIAGKTDLVLLDVLLADENGLELLRHVRARYPRIPVLVVTGRQSACAEALARDLGATGYCGHPQRHGLLEDLVLKHLRNCTAYTGKS